MTAISTLVYLIQIKSLQIKSYSDGNLIIITELASSIMSSLCLANNYIAIGALDCGVKLSYSWY